MENMSAIGLKPLWSNKNSLEAGSLLKTRGTSVSHGGKWRITKDQAYHFNIEIEVTFCAKYMIKVMNGNEEGKNNMSC